MPNHFLGRESLLGELIQQMLSGDSLALSAEGLPGVGKTTLAVALAYRQEILTHFSDGVLWGGLGRVPDVMSTLAKWAEALGGDVTDKAEPQDRHEAVRHLIGQNRLLLIIDDAWEIEVAQQLRCGGPNCVHLLTTRNKGIAEQFAGSQQSRQVPILDDEPAFTLLQQLAPQACAVDPDTARNLTQAVGGLPLAIELLGGYLADPNAPERKYFPEATQAALVQMSIPAQRLQLAIQRLGSQDGPMTLQAIIELSLADLPDTTRDAFYALGAFAPKPATFSQEAALAVTQAKQHHLALLLERNLLEQTNGQLSLHQTLADVATFHLSLEVQTRHRDYFLNEVNANREDWRHIQTLYEQIQWAWLKAFANLDVLGLIWDLREYQRRRGLWFDYLAWANQGLKICQEHGLRKNEGSFHNSIGTVYKTLGRQEIALEHFQKALSIRNQEGDRAGLAATLNNMGSVYEFIGQRQEAVSYFQKALDIWIEVGDKDGLARTLNNIGKVHNSLGQYEIAMKYFQQALSISNEVSDRTVLAVTFNNIGMIHNDLGQWQKALDYYEKALPILEDTGDRAGLATTLNNVGGVYSRLKRWQFALSYYQQALPIQERIGDLVGLATTWNNIGLVCFARGQQQDALTHYQRALSILVEVNDRAGEAVTRYNISTVYRAQSRLSEAIKELHKVIELDSLVQSPELEADIAKLAEIEAELAQQEKS